MKRSCIVQILTLVFSTGLLAEVSQETLPLTEEIIEQPKDTSAPLEEPIMEVLPIPINEPEIPQETFEMPKAEEPLEDLSDEEKAMRAIEPSFVPKDDRVTDLFLLEKFVKEQQEKIQKAQEAKGKISASFFQRFQQGLDGYLEKSLDDKEARYSKSVKEVAKTYGQALSFDPDNQSYDQEALYILGFTAFEEDEKNYFEQLAKYNDAREKGLDNVDYPMENFSRTIDAYETLIAKYPKFKYLDNVYYLYALSLLYEGAFDESVDTFKLLVTNYPKSKFTEEVWFRLGEYFYDMDEFDNALNAYGKILKNKKSPFYDKVIYKIAWTYFQKDQYDLTIKNFALLLRLIYSKNYQGTLSGIKQEAVTYLVKSFAEKQFLAEAHNKTKKNAEEEKEYQNTQGMQLANSIYKYLTKNKKPPFAKDVMIEVASRLLDEGKTDGAVLAFELAIKLQPRNPDNPRIAAQIVDVLQDAGEKERAKQKNLELIRRYGPKSRWIKGQKENTDAYRFARDAVRDAILSLAVLHHKNGKEFLEKDDKVEAQKNFRDAARFYIRYIREYPERDDTYKAIFYFAESVYELKRYKTALQAYQLLKEYPLPMPEPFRRDAVFNIIFTFKGVLEEAVKDKEFKKIDFDNLTSKYAGKEEEEIPKIGIDYLESINDFLAIAPKDEQVPVLLFHAAAIYYVYGHLEEASQRFEFIIDNYPSSSAASVAARLILDDAINKEDWVKVAQLAKRFREENLGGQAQDFSKIEGNARFKIAKAVFEQANALSKDGQVTNAKEKYKESAVLFETLLSEDPKNPYADIMLFNAAKAIVQSGSSVAALPYYKKLYAEYPNSEFAKPARFQEAFLLEKMLKFADAAKAYDGIIRQDPGSEAAADAMLNKALLYEAAGDLKNASESYIAFSKNYPDRPEAAVTLLTAASIYKKMNLVDKQIAMLDQFVKKYQKNAQKIPEVIEAKVMIADTYNDLFVQSKNPKYQKLRDDNYKEVVKLYDPSLTSAFAAFYAAKAHLFLEKPEQDSFKKMSINAPTGAAQATQLTNMMKKLTELSQKNENIIKLYAQPVRNAESLYRIGELYFHLAKALADAPCPRDVKAIDEFACDEYAMLLEEKASVIEEKALDAYKQAYEIALDSYDAPAYLLDNIISRLSVLRPGEYQKAGDALIERNTYTFGTQGRMLSNGKMSSSLHPKEVDPDLSSSSEMIEEPQDEMSESDNKHLENPEKEQEKEEELEDDEEEDVEDEDEEF